MNERTPSPEPENSSNAVRRGPARIRTAVIAVLVLAFIAGTGWYQVSRMTAGEPAKHDIVAASTGVRIGGPFTLTAHTGERVSDTDFRGDYMLVFFGYTFCPDVCPTKLTTISDALDMLEPDAATRIQPLFVSVDPQRDTPERLAEYVQAFHPRLIGLTGSEDEVAATARAYRAFYARAEGGDEDTYLVDHSALTYLMGPDGEFLTTFSYTTPAEGMASGLRKFIDPGS